MAAAPTKGYSRPPSSQPGSPDVAPGWEHPPSAASLGALVSLRPADEEGKSIPKRFESPVEVPTAVFDGLETVQQSGEASMVDCQAVQEIATRLGYPEAALWVREHQHEYLEGVFRGFVVVGR